MVSQQKVNDLIMNFVVGDMQAFSVVESPEFIQLVTGLQPSKTVLTRKAITACVEDKHSDMLKTLQNTLSGVIAVCTTADVWTCCNRSFFGVTVHWIEESSLERKSAALACSRMRGKHTFDLIASTLGIRSKFRIANKVICTVTDKGSNFVKALKEFSEPEPEPHPKPKPESKNADATQAVLSQADDSEVIFTNVSDILEGKKILFFHLIIATLLTR